MSKDFYKNPIGKTRITDPIGQNKNQPIVCPKCGEQLAIDIDLATTNQGLGQIAALIIKNIRVSIRNKGYS